MSESTGASGGGFNIGMGDMLVVRTSLQPFLSTWLRDWRAEVVLSDSTAPKSLEAIFQPDSFAAYTRKRR